jgi:hypothetical protein
MDGASDCVAHAGPGRFGLGAIAQNLRRPAKLAHAVIGRTKRCVNETGDEQRSD